ncbi:hypothetical protein [Herbaspirillum chlorophenolicum]|jgi:hypothetical protein|uniref:hypothetical protein n=1 Tax=Herbaspirillum chlorophenolicum TaxID=211589 RepID=UPI000AEA9F3F|nr:hypothetical protein [Herbaspirillum chlorophenolicum]
METNIDAAPTGPIETRHDTGKPAPALPLQPFHRLFAQTSPTFRQAEIVNLC